MSSAIKAMIQHQAALTQIDEMHRRTAARTRVHVPAKPRRRHTIHALLLTPVRSLRPVLRGEGA